jgi:pimeloyl-ACP methyl ester carboxylesterase
MEHLPPRRPDREEIFDGLAYTLWLPDPLGAVDRRGEPTRPVPQPPWPGVVILHGAGSSKENHADFARLAAANGWAALAFDQRGHGASWPPMSPEAIDDVLKMARLLGAASGVDGARIAVRGSSMGGFMAIQAAATSPEIAAVVAICPAWADSLSRGLRRDEFDMRIGDRDQLLAWLAGRDLGDAAERITGRPLFLLHAEGDEEIPYQRSEELHERAGDPKRLLVVPGGTHRSLQHDAELQSEALRWTARNLRRS